MSNTINRRKGEGVYEYEYQQMLKRLKHARVAAGFTQADVAKHLKKPQSYMSKCESGERRLDPIEIKHFARLYKKSLEYFI